jgi:NADH-quinone oxidoreductase subunit C
MSQTPTGGTQEPSSTAVGGEEVVPSEARTLEVVEVREGMFGIHGSGDTTGYGGLQRPIVMPGASHRPFGG